jgi:hypothetical protein
MSPEPQEIVYRSGACAICAQALARTDLCSDVRLHVIGPTGVVTIRCFIHTACLPQPAEVNRVSRRLSARLVAWYRTTPEVWPVLAGATGGLY